MKLDTEDLVSMETKTFPPYSTKNGFLGCCAQVKGNRGCFLRYIFYQLCDAESTLRTEEISSFPVVTHLSILICGASE